MGAAPERWPNCGGTNVGARAVRGCSRVMPGPGADLGADYGGYNEQHCRDTSVGEDGFVATRTFHNFCCSTAQHSQFAHAGGRVITPSGRLERLCVGCAGTSTSTALHSCWDSVVKVNPTKRRLPGFASPN